MDGKGGKEPNVSERKKYSLDIHNHYSGNVDHEGLNKKKKNQNQNNEEKKKESLSNYTKIGDIFKKHEWEKCKEVFDSEDGASGVFFLITKNDEVVVVKGSIIVAEEILASLIAKKFNIVAPKCRLVEYHPNFQKDYGYDWAGIKNIIHKLTYGRGNYGMFNKFNKNLTRAFYLLMEFVVAKPVYHIKDYKTLFSKNQVLRDLGRIFVFDVFVNNYDRFFSRFWKHDGNLGNLLFDISKGRVIGIDQSVNPIKKKFDSKRKEYFSTVKEMLENHFHKKLEDDEFVKCICDFIYSGTHYKMSIEQKKEIWIGMDESIKIVRDKIDKKYLVDLKEKVKKMKTGNDWENVYQKSMEKIDIEFIVLILNIFKNFKIKK